MSTAIWWLRRDLRLHDNPGLEAAKRHEYVIPLFILDPFFEGSRYVGDKRRSFLYSSLIELSSDLGKHGSRLILRGGKPLEVLQSILNESGAEVIYAANDYSPYAVQRDDELQHELPITWVDGPCAQPPGSILKSDGDPYTVFTPFSKAWKKLLLPDLVAPPKDHEDFSLPHGLVGIQPDQLSIPFTNSTFPPGEQNALRLLENFTHGPETPIYRYSDMRNRIDTNLTSKLSPYLKFGSLSPRRAVASAITALKNAPDKQAEKGAETWLNELIWRDFYLHILFHFPYVRMRNFREQEIHWVNNRDDFESWKGGLTGYPIVDAGMRQLSQDGWIHNRIRMIVASFLVKDLLIDWRWGERWFMQHLIDGDPASNNGGWQWTAGTGTDAAPYFRVFNPILQSKKFDPQGSYIRTWISELQHVPAKHIHTPWLMTESEQKKSGCIIGKNYPAPIVDHQWARRRAVEAFRQ